MYKNIHNCLKLHLLNSTIGTFKEINSNIIEIKTLINSINEQSENKLKAIILYEPTVTELIFICEHLAIELQQFLDITIAATHGQLHPYAISPSEFKKYLMNVKNYIELSTFTKNKRWN